VRYAVSNQNFWANSSEYSIQSTQGLASTWELQFQTAQLNFTSKVKFHNRSKFFCKRAKKTAISFQKVVGEAGYQWVLAIIAESLYSSTKAENFDKIHLNFGNITLFIASLSIEW